MLTNLRPPAALLAGGLLLAARTHAADPAPIPGTGQADTVAGIVLDPSGQPIAGARVRAENNVLHSWVEVRTDATGHYTLTGLALGGWNVYAWKQAAYKGQTYALRLGMPAAADYGAFAPGSQGAVRNFRWQLSGPIPDRDRTATSGAGYFGGTLRLVNLDASFHSLPDGTTVTLTPVAGATLFDGRAATVVQRSFTTATSSPAQYSYFLPDMPQCEYRITAESSCQGVRKALPLSSRLSQPYAPAIEHYYFKPDGSSGHYESGLAGPQNEPVYLLP